MSAATDCHTSSAPGPGPGPNPAARAPWSGPSKSGSDPRATWVVSTVRCVAKEASAAGGPGVVGDDRVRTRAPVPKPAPAPAAAPDGGNMCEGEGGEAPAEAAVRRLGSDSRPPLPATCNGYI